MENQKQSLPQFEFYLKVWVDAQNELMTFLTHCKSNEYLVCRFFLFALKTRINVYSIMI